MDYFEKKKLALARADREANEHIYDMLAIQEHLSCKPGDIKLSTKQEEKLKQYNFAYNQISSGRYSEKEVINQIDNQYACGRGTALRILREAKEIYRTYCFIDKEFETKMLLETMKITHRKATAVGDLKTAAQCEKNMHQLLANLPEQVEEFDFTPHQNVIEFNPGLLGIQEIDPKKIRDLINRMKSEYGLKDIDTTFIDAEIIEPIDDDED